MDIIYTLSKEAAESTDDWELRMSLRSWVMNYANLGMIFIVGHAPKWLDLEHRKIDHIPFPDSYRSNKDANLIQKLIYASCHLGDRYEAGLDYPFIFCSDDQGLLQPIRTEAEEAFAFQPWQGGVIRSEAKNRFRKRLSRTGMFLTARKCVPYFHDVHIPFKLTPAGCLSALRSDFGEGVGYTVMSLILGLHGVRRPPDINKHRIRALFNGRRHSVEKMREMLSGNLFYSLSDKAAGWEELCGLIEERFPTPAAWEMDRK